MVTAMSIGNVGGVTKKRTADSRRVITPAMVAAVLVVTLPGLLNLSSEHRTRCRGVIAHAMVFTELITPRTVVMSG